MTRPKTRSDEDVLAAAARVLGRLGPHDFTLADVAREAKLSPATLSQRFGSKRGLVVAFGRWAAREADAPFAVEARRGGPALGQLRRALVTLAGPAVDRREFANHLALLVEDVRDPELRHSAAAHARRTEDNIAQLLRAAAQAGEAHLAPPERWAGVIFAAWNGALIQWGLRGNKPLPAWLDDVLLPLLSPRPPAARRAKRRPRG